MNPRLLALLLVVATACSSSPKTGGSTDGGAGRNCTRLDTVVSPEKFELLSELARRFNARPPAGDDRCIAVQVRKVASGAAAQLLSEEWPETAGSGPRPVIWSPASSAWAAILNERLLSAGRPAMAPPGRPFMLTPLVIAMPRPMAEALGYPSTPLGFRDILALAQDPAGWGARGHPEWGAFKLGKTNPNFSTSGLSATIAQYYAATQKVRDLSAEDLSSPRVDAFSRAVESSVVHYGDITLTFLNNWYRNDARGTALTYVSAVAVEEKSVVDYNLGNPDGISDPGERPRPPKVPLVAVYPKEGTLFSDNPFITLDAPWVSDRQRRAARSFESFVLRPDNQRRVVEFGFRPGNTEVAGRGPVNERNGVDPDQPQNVLPVPDPSVLVRLLDKWGQHRKPARVLLVIDVSGSMGDPAGEGTTKLELAKSAAIDSLALFKPEDQVGLRTFSTGVGGRNGADFVDLVPVGPLAGQRESIEAKIRALVPVAGTPLYTATQASYELLRDSYDPARINAAVILSDGRNEDTGNRDVEAMLSVLRAGSEGQSGRPVRLFTVAYGKDADLGVLRRISDATNAATYDARDPATITKVFTDVVSNF